MGIVTDEYTAEYCKIASELDDDKVQQAILQFQLSKFEESKWQKKVIKISKFAFSIFALHPHSSNLSRSNVISAQC